LNEDELEYSCAASYSSLAHYQNTKTLRNFLEDFDEEPCHFTSPNMSQVDQFELLSVKSMSPSMPSSEIFNEESLISASEEQKYLSETQEQISQDEMSE